MFKRKKQPYLVKGFKPMEARTALEEHPEKPANMGSKSSRSKPSCVCFTTLPPKLI